MATPPAVVPDDAHLHDWPAVTALSAGWALSFSVVTASITATNLASSAFSPSSSWNTVPLAILLVALSGWSMALPTLFTKLGGRLNTYRVTSCVGMVASVTASLACSEKSFAALCVSSVLFALPSAAGQSFRFAVLSLVPARSRPKCIGLVLTGGIAGAVIGPLYAAAAKNMFADAPFAGVYVCTGVAFFLLLCIVSVPGLVTFPAEGGQEAAGGEKAPGGSEEPCGKSTDGKGESTEKKNAEPKNVPSVAVAASFARFGFVAAVAIAALSYGAMSFLMSPTPLAMRDRGFSFHEVSHVILSHMLGMYAPSFVSGGAVARFGWRPVAAVGAGLFVVASVLMQDGVSMKNFVGGQLVLGIGWNLCFVAATSEVAKVSMEEAENACMGIQSRSVKAAQKAKSAQRVQSAADVVTFAFAGAASVASGPALAKIHWREMQIVGWVCAGLMLVFVKVAGIKDARKEEDVRSTEKGEDNV